MTAGKSFLLSLRNVYETLSVSAPTVIDAYRGTLTRRVCDERLESWASRVIANAEIMIAVHGRENVPAGPRASYLVMSNHQSHYDIAVLYSVLGARMRMVAKQELFELPVFGRAIRAAGFIPVDRRKRESAVHSLEDAKAMLAAGTPIWIAPEGRRSPTGELLPFKKGGFVLAVTTGAPIVPVSVRGTRDILRAKEVRSRRGVQVFVTIHPPVDPVRLAAGDARATRDALAAEVRRAIASGL